MLLVFLEVFSLGLLLFRERVMCVGDVSCCEYS